MVLHKLLDYTAKGEVEGGWGPEIPAERAQWRAFLDKLVPFPLVVHNGTTLYKDADYADGSTVAWDSNSDYGISRYAAVFPAQLVGLESPPSVQALGWNTVKILNDAFGWISSGGLDMNFPAAGRTVPRGREAWLLNLFTAKVNQTIGPNGYTECGAGGAGLESIGALEGIHSLMLQSHEGVIRVFPRWPAGSIYEASFQTLRANGAFLISARWDGAAVATPVMIHSEAGAACTIQNPFEGALCVVDQRTKDKVPTKTGHGAHVSFKTARGGGYALAPCA